MKILSVVGARPEFVQAAPISRVLKDASIQEILVHTGQHYDYLMSEVFFKQLGLPVPHYNLEVGSGTHGMQTGEILSRMEDVILREKPDWVIVRGDTNSTLAAALAAVKIHYRLGHIEAGLRSFNREMPEEINRIVTDHLSNALFCPSENAIKNLRDEGIIDGVFNVGDVMYDAVIFNEKIASKSSNILSEHCLTPNKYLVATIHRAENTDRMENLRGIIEAFLESGEQIIFPVHPRTRLACQQLDIPDANIKMISPVSYFDMLILVKNARLLLTDSGGLQKEAFFLETPCITLRNETEWVETVEAGWNILVGSHRQRILGAIRDFHAPHLYPRGLYGDGNAAGKIVNVLTAKETLGFRS